jgi:glutamate racemase
MTIDERPIALMDSGVGGLPYLAAARRLLPGERYVYLADRGGFPYGTKSPEAIREIVLDRVARLVSAFGPKALVIACNTASQAALTAVRAANPGLAVIGTVPAVKPAAERTRSGVIGIMATARAVQDPYLDELVARFAKGVRVLREGAQDLVRFVEHRMLSASDGERREAVEPAVRRLVDGGADEIVIACTHFLHLRPDIALIAGPAVEVVDSRDGVARRLKAVLAERRLASGPAARGPDEAGRDAFVLTGDTPFEDCYAQFAARFELAAPSALDGCRP